MKTVQDISLSEVKKKEFKKIRKCSVKPVLAIIGSLNLKKKKNSKIRCETGSGFYREFNLLKKIQISGVKPVLAPIGSLKFQK